MDKVELSKKILEWREKKIELNALEKEICDEISLLKETIKISDVEAKFSKGRKTYDYESAGQFAPNKIIKNHTTTVESTDWKSVCIEAGIKDIPFTEGQQKASISIKDNKVDKSQNNKDMVTFDECIDEPIF